MNSGTVLQQSSVTNDTNLLDLGNVHLIRESSQCTTNEESNKSKFFTVENQESMVASTGENINDISTMNLSNGEFNVESKSGKFPSVVNTIPICTSNKSNHLLSLHFPVNSKVFKEDYNKMSLQIEANTNLPLYSSQIEQSRELILQSPFHCATKDTPSKILYLNSKDNKGALIVSDEIKSHDTIKGFNTNQTVIVSSPEKQNSLKINVPKSPSVSENMDSILLDKKPFVSNVSINLPISPSIKSILIASTLPDQISQFGSIVVASSSNKLTVPHQAHSCRTNTNTTACIVSVAVCSSTKKSAESSSFKKPNACFSNIRTSLPNVTKSLQNTCIVQPFNYHSPVKTVAMPSGPYAATTQVSSACRRYVLTFIYF